MKTKVKKLLILLAALALPIFVFIFLKTFGKNEFSVAPLFQETVPPVSAMCGPVAAPYILDESRLKELRWSVDDSLTLYVFNTVVFDEKELTLRLSESQAGESVELHNITSDSTQQSEDRDPIVMGASAIQQLLSCFFIMEKKTNAVLVDSERRIRGHYNLSEREEIDRLLVEIKIIQKEY